MVGLELPIEFAVAGLLLILSYGVWQLT